ncbi:hypothetical protein [Kribbella lupini]|uniref:Uncharacterized protein n=1 Tax=Kribbella lupini TaxID=291602 RepID=A0ABN2BPG2_9ACTN
MYWFLLFLAVVAVWLVVLALLAKKVWGQTKALTRELVAAQSKLEAAQRPGPDRTPGSVGPRA